MSIHTGGTMPGEAGALSDQNPQNFIVPPSPQEREAEAKATREELKTEEQAAKTAAQVEETETRRAPNPLQNEQQQEVVAGPQMMTTGVTSSTTSRRIDPKMLKKYEKEQALVDEAVKAQIGAVTARDRALAGEFDRQAVENSRMLDEEVRATEAAQIRMEAEREQLRDLVDEYSSMEVDPSRLFNNMSTGNKLLAGVSLLLGAVGQGEASSNAAFGVIDAAIERDIAAQEKDIDIAGRAITERKSLMQNLRTQFKDNAERRSVARSIMQTRLANQMDALKLRAGTEVQAATLERGAAEMRAKAAANLAQASTISSTRTSTQKMVAPGARQVVNQKAFEKMNELQGKKQELGELYETAKEIEDQVGERSGVKAYLSGLKARIKSGAGFSLSQAEEAIIKLGAQEGAMLANVIKFYSGAAASDREVKRIKAFLPRLANGTATFEEFTDALNQGFNRDIAVNEATAYGETYRPGTTVEDVRARRSLDAGARSIGE